MSPTNDAQQRFERLFRAHHAAVLAYVRRRAPAERVDDAVAETFLVVWRRLERVPDEPLPWLLSVARKVLATGARAERRRRALGLRLSREPSAAAAAPEPASTVSGALARMAPRDREALTLIAWDSLTPAQAAVALGEPAGAVRVRLHRARKRMAALLAAETEPSPTSETVHEQPTP